MDKKSIHSSVVLVDPLLLAKSRLGVPTNFISTPLTGIPYSAGFPCTQYFASKWRKSRPNKLDDVRSSGWLDAMKSSSPTHVIHNKDAGAHDGQKEDIGLAYQSWTQLHPSAVESFEQIATSAQGKQVALFLDYDGTLSPIVDDPDCAFMSDMMRSVVSDVAKCFPTAIISGRCRDKVYEFVRLGELYYAGSHGMDIMGPPQAPASSGCRESCMSSPNIQKKDILFQPAAHFLPVINEVYEFLVDCMREVSGVKVENNKFCVSVHYRCVDEQSWDMIGRRVYNILLDYPQLQLCHGRKVLEVRPVIKWDKGKALEFLLDSIGLSDCLDVFPIYIGDDRTDEDAFRVLREKHKGYGILVSAVPKSTCAYYSVRNPSEVMVFLQSLIKWKRTGDTVAFVQ